MQKAQSTELIVVADGRKAALYRNEGTGGEMVLRGESELSPKHLASDGPSGSRPEEQTPGQTDEATFAKQLAETLYKKKQDGEFGSLVIVADPQTLGQLRAALHKTVEALRHPDPCQRSHQPSDARDRGSAEIAGHRERLDGSEASCACKCELPDVNRSRCATSGSYFGKA